MITKISAELVALTHLLAVQISSMQSLPGERPVKAARLKFFEHHLNDGSFTSPTWSTAIIKGTRDEFRADGQHTSSVLAAIPPDQFPPDLKVTLQRFEIDSISEDGAALFDMFDNPQSARTNTDVMGFYRASHPDLQAIPTSHLIRVANGIDFYLRELPDGEHRCVTREHGLYFRQEKYRRFANWLSQWLDARHEWMLSKSGLVAEMLADWILSEPLANEFWGYVVTDSHPDVDHETRDLAHKLNEWRKQPRYKQSQFRRQAKTVWNRYRRVEEAERAQKVA